MISINIKHILDGPDGSFPLHIDCQIKTQTLSVVYGESGAGKTTTLRFIAGLTDPVSGRISFNSQTWFDSDRKISLKPQIRSVGMVFQDAGLFPNMTVNEHLHYALLDKQDRITVREWLETMELAGLKDKRPPQLSGGQRQRVALACAVIQKPDLLLLDEPFTALDHRIKAKMFTRILDIHRRFDLTTMIVTHDPTDMLRHSDHLMELKDGKLIERPLKKEPDPVALIVDKSMMEDRFILILEMDGKTYNWPVPKASWENYHVGERLRIGREG